MSRNPFKPAEIHAEPGAVPESHQITLSDEAQAKDIEQEMFALAMRDVGAYQALDMVEKISGRAKAEIYIRQEKTKAYRALTYKAEDGSRKKIPDIDTFCEVFFGKTGRSIRSTVQNYHLLGPELYEASERLGFKGKDYTALKALPADDQEVIKQAMQADDRGEVLDLLQEMAARHASEKAALAAQAKEATDTAAARDDVIKRKEETISRLEVRAASAERRQADFTDIERAGYECAPLHDTINESIVALTKMATEVKRLVEEVGGELVTEECFHAVLLPIKRALEIAAHNRLHIDLATLFDEETNASVEALQARAAGLTGALQ